ncbi:MAG TPA: LysE family transporter [Bacteroidales bacterium]|nr:LysE family transporter [Bacteroidales bacterium]
MLETITKGFIIGLLVSSPMGPINILTIQRTLNRGRWHGLASGVGAMLSDITYATITMLGLSFVSGFMNDYESELLLFGSIILILFGFGVYRSNPLKGWQPDNLPTESRYFKDFISTFLLTFSNATIILALVGLYTRFSFNPILEGTASLIVALISFSIAALLWWFILTTLVSRLRKRFKRKGLVILNRVVGTIFIVIGVAGIIQTLTSVA